jgi:predicted acyltransferase (DUF342 family)
MNGNVYGFGKTILNGDVSMNSRLFVGSDISMNGNIYGFGKTILNGDVSMNSGLFVSNDVTINGRLNVYEYQNNSIIYTNVTTTNYTLVVGEDVSLNGRLVVIGDSSFNSRIFVSGDSSFNGNLYTFGRTILQGDVSINKRLFIGSDVSMSGNFYTDGRTIHQGDVSLNTRLFVGSDVSMSGNFYTGGRTIHQGDVSLNTRLFVGSDVSMGGNLFINNILKPTTISESFTTITTGSSPYTLNYSTGSVFYLAPPPASNFTCNITGVPYDTGRTYVITLIIDSSTNKTFCNSVQINGSTAFTPWFANGIPTSITSGNSISQSLAIQRIIGGGSADLSSNSKVLSSVTPWY